MFLFFLFFPLFEGAPLLRVGPETPVFVNSVPVFGQNREKEIVLLTGSERQTGSDGSPVELETPDYRGLEVEKEEAWDEEKGAEFMSRDLLEALKKYQKENDLGEMETQIGKWEKMLNKDGATEAIEGSTGATEGAESISSESSSEVTSEKSE